MIQVIGTESILSVYLSDKDAKRISNYSDAATHRLVLKQIAYNRPAQNNSTLIYSVVTARWSALWILGKYEYLAANRSLLTDCIFCFFPLVSAFLRFLPDVVFCFLGKRCRPRWHLSNKSVPSSLTLRQNTDRKATSL